jgi:putative nucleotidyltransferase with HDIG domain
MSTGTGMKPNDIRPETLPTLPEIAHKLLTLPLDTVDGEAQLLKLIGNDPVISSKIIGLANSSLFGAPIKISSISDAAMRLGLNTVKAVAIGIATMSVSGGARIGKFKPADLWAHSMAIAYSMHAISAAMPARVRPVDDSIFLAGLLHDMGYMALAHINPDVSDALFDAMKNIDLPLLETEREVAGMTHTEIGVALGHHWDLPEEIIAVMAYHHIPNDEKAQVGQPLVSMVNLAEKILPEFGLTASAESTISEQEWLDLGIDPARAERVIGQLQNVALMSKELSGIF